jgi:hypothetical protein
MKAAGIERSGIFTMAVARAVATGCGTSATSPKDGPTMTTDGAETPADAGASAAGASAWPSEVVAGASAAGAPVRTNALYLGSAFGKPPVRGEGPRPTRAGSKNQATLLSAC